eukprot:8049069-Heterocapsa_arctica.AAC.1
MQFLPPELPSVIDLLTSKQLPNQSRSQRKRHCERWWALPVGTLNREGWMTAARVFLEPKAQRSHA